ncbi:MAG: Thioredoxin reductase [Berkelbacteria bacterium GW2011_GWA2_38_9]|uniref:Thioredoxin reductase n=1 Tax=Berkelbacteria bacterium GW2011_GWA2_38_9 TaxID=1618334 RepID=A0A0G0LFL5_9BACT|nr:MAG: Thioredoxin reductase [Berkelbacteria bacterium GW2011_GWA2_38_9]
MDRFRQQTENLGTTIIDQTVSKVELSKKLFKVIAGHKTYLTKSIIIATGATARYLGIESETKFRGKGVSACATCDGPFFKNKDVLVIGGGDTAMEEAQFLTKFANSVKIIHRRDQFRASKIMIDRVTKNPKIKFVLNSVINEFIGNSLLEGAVVENIKTHTKQTIKASGAFIAIGHVPNTNVFQGILPIGEKGYIETNNPPFTNIEGIFVAGDVYDYKYRQAITAAGSGCQAAIQVEKYLADLS